MSVPELLDAVGSRLRVLKAARNLYKDRLAPEFNVFDFFELEARSEAGLSRVVHWLLDPMGSHGQGGQFLQLFTAETGHEWPRGVCDKARARLEFHDPEFGRPDIAVEAQDYFMIVENKISAQDGDKQIYRYIKIVNSRATSVRHLVFLTPEGRAPSEGSLPSGVDQKLDEAKFSRMRYLTVSGETDAESKSIHTWLDRCRLACGNERVSMILSEFSNHLRRRFDGVRDMSDGSAIVEEIKRKEGGIESALKIHRSVKDLEADLLRTLSRQIEVNTKVLGLGFVNELSPV